MQILNELPQTNDFSSPKQLITFFYVDRLYTIRRYEADINFHYPKFIVVEIGK